MFVNPFKITNAEHFTPEFLNELSTFDDIIDLYYKYLNRYEQLKKYNLKVSKCESKIIDYHDYIIEKFNEIQNEYNIKFNNMKNILYPEGGYLHDEN